MKTFALSFFLLSTLSANAGVTECEQDTSLACTVTYWKATAPGQSIKIEESSTSKLILQNSDEPSLAYCEARNGFNKHGFYIEAAYLPSSKEVSIRMMRERDASGGYYTDQSRSTAKLRYGEEATASLSLAGINPEGFYAAEITCTLEQ